MTGAFAKRPFQRPKPARIALNRGAQISLEYADKMNADSAPDPLVLFMPSGKRGRFPVGTTVLDAARQLGVYVESVCGGRATCGRCQIEVQEGNFAKHKIVSSNDHISPAAPRRSATSRARPARRPPPVLLGDDPGRSRHRRAAGHRRQRPDRPQGAPPTGSSSAIRPCSSAMSRSTSPTCTSRSATSTG